jgi:hypothetical protein
MIDLVGICQELTSSFFSAFSFFLGAAAFLTFSVFFVAVFLTFAVLSVAAFLTFSVFFVAVFLTAVVAFFLGAVFFLGAYNNY